MTLNKSKQEQIFILLSQGKKLQEIADELGISIGTVWNYINGNHKNEKREPHKQAVSPQPRVIPKEASLSAMKVNTVQRYPIETNILITDYYTQWQLLQNAIQQDAQEEQNKLAEEYRKKKSDDRKQADVRAYEHQQMMNRGIVEVRKLKERKQHEERAQIEKKILEMTNRFIQNLNKPSKILQKTQSDNGNQKPSEEKVKVKIPNTQPQSSPLNIKINNPDIVSDRIISREKPLAKPPEIPKNSSIELKKTSHDYIGIDWLQIILKSITATVQPWVNLNNEPMKKTCVSPGYSSEEPNTTKPYQKYNITDVIRNTIPRYLPQGFTFGCPLVPGRDQ